MITLYGLRLYKITLARSNKTRCIQIVGISSEPNELSV